MKWKDLCKDVLHHVPESRAKCLEEVVEKFLYSEKSTCGIRYIMSRIEVPKHYDYFGKEMPRRVVLDSNVLGHIVQRYYCAEFEFWRNCIKIIENIEQGKVEGKIRRSSLSNIDDILTQTRIISKDHRVKELIKKSILSVPNLGFKEPKIQAAIKKYGDIIGNYRLKSGDIEDLFVAYIADKEGASILTYDSFLLSRLPGLPDAFTPEEFLGYQIPSENCKTFCEFANKFAMVPPLDLFSTLNREEK